MGDRSITLPRCGGSTENARLENAGPFYRGWKMRDQLLWNAEGIRRARKTIFCTMKTVTRKSCTGRSYVVERTDAAVIELQISPVIVDGFKNGFHQWIQRIFFWS